MRWMIGLMVGLGFFGRSLVADEIVIDKEKKSVTIPAKIAPRKLATLDQIYPVEVIACWPTEKKGQKAHETAVIFDAKPSDVHKAMERFGLTAGKPAQGEGEKPLGPELKVILQWPIA